MAYKTERDIKNRTVPDKLLAKLSYVASPTPTVTPTVTPTPSVTPTPTVTPSSTIDNKLWSWGRNTTYGMLGLGDTIDRSSPVQVGSLSNYKSLASMGAVIKQDGTLWTWGNNNAGALGVGDTVSRSSPVQVGTDTTWVAIYGSPTGGNMLGKKSDNTAYAWGSNSSGRLGVGDTVDRSSPVQIGGGAVNWAVFAVGAHCLGADGSGNLYSWGNNGNGQLGLGDTTSRTSPIVANVLNKSWVLLAVGGNHSLAANHTGLLSVWGYNGFGQLGLGDNTQRNTITQNLNIVDVAISPNCLAAGSNTSYYISTAGKLYSFGRNDQGQIGDGTKTDRYQRNQVGTGTNWKAVYAGGDSVLALKTDGTLWAWGYGTYGVLGLGNQSAYSSPVQIGTLTTWKGAGIDGQSSYGVKS